MSANLLSTGKHRSISTHHSCCNYKYSTTTTTSNPPPKCLDGGQWGTLQYTGSKTGAFICLGRVFVGFLGLAFLNCPQDQKDAYCVNGRLYDAAGVDVGGTTNLFTPRTKQYRGVETPYKFSL